MCEYLTDINGMVRCDAPKLSEIEPFRSTYSNKKKARTSYIYEVLAFIYNKQLFICQLLTDYC